MGDVNAVEVVKDPAALTDQVERYREPLDQGNIITLSELGGGVIRFAQAAFPGADIDSVYAQHNVREREGRGPHFDIYTENIHVAYPWLGVYNLAGRCTVRAAIMPQELSEQYATLYPEANGAAHDARRHLGAFVLGSETTNTYSGKLQKDTGLILPQQKDGPDVIHEVIPENPAKAGSFIKLVVPKDDPAIHDSLRAQRYMPLDELLTSGYVESGNDSKVTPLPPAPGRDEAQSQVDVGDQLLD